MSKTYVTAKGSRSALTQRGYKDGVKAAVQSYDGSVCVSNWYDGDELKIRVGTNDGSGCYSDSNSCDFVGTFQDLKRLLKLAQDVKSGEASIVRHRKKASGLR